MAGDGRIGHGLRRQRLQPLERAKRVLGNGLLTSEAETHLRQRRLVQPSFHRERIAAYALYTDPPLGRAGMTEAEVRTSGKPALIATIAMEDVSRAFEKGETKGFMKILVDHDSKQILGASCLGLTGDEVIHCILDLMYANAPYSVMQRAMHIHPTVSEFIPTMLGDLKPLQ